MGAALPRRVARDNRRGKILKESHQQEDRETASKLPVYKAPASTSAVRSITSTRGFKSSSQTNSVKSTPEMDRLEARSKAAKLKQVSTSSTEPKRIKLATNQNSNTKVAAPIAKQTSPTKSPPKAVETISPTSTKSKNSNGFKKFPPTKTQTNSTDDSSLKARKKLKRNSFQLPSTEPVSKISKC